MDGHKQLCTISKVTTVRNSKWEGWNNNPAWAQTTADQNHHSLPWFSTMQQTPADIQENLMLKKGVSNRNKILEADNFTSQTASTLQQSVEYDWFYTDAHYLLFAKKIILLSDHFCLISQGCSGRDGWKKMRPNSWVPFFSREIVPSFLL